MTNGRSDHLLRVITWNVRKGKGANGAAPAVSSLAEAIRRRSPSLVLVQEAFRGATGTAACQSEELAGRLEMAAAFGPNMFYRRGCHGNSILTRLPIAEAENVDLSTNPVERRGALYARLETPDGPLHVVSTHLGLNTMQRRRQVRRLSRLLADRVPEGEPLVMGGDFNDWTGRLHDRILKSCRVAGALEGLTAPERRSYPSRRPRFGLDRFYVRHVEVEACFVLKAPSLRTLSDHLPVEADLRL